MVEMEVGSRFWYKDKLYEVTEFKSGFGCKGCVFLAGLNCKCKKAKCFCSERHDGKEVYYREVKE